MKKIGLSLGFFMFILMIFAQPKIQFDSQTYDFQTIKEEGGKVTGRFNFTNVGDKDLMLVKVQPGCGCTAANYTKEAVPPGGTGFIDATYDPYNRPGNFNKNIRVTTNEPAFDEPNTPPHMIFIKGLVEKRKPTPQEEAGYTQGRGLVRMKETNSRIELMNSEIGQISFFVRNFLETESKFVPINLPDYFTVETPTFKNNLAPEQEAEVIIKFDPQKKNQIGSFREVISFETDDPAEPRLAYLIDIYVKEDFSKYTKEQIMNAPVVEIETTDVDFGQVNVQSTSTTQQIKVTNKGKSQLNIRQLLVNKNSFFMVSADKNLLQPGESAILTITFTPRRAGVQRATIDLTTNDPVNTVIIINVTGESLQ